MKSSTELIAMARNIVQGELERCIERGNQPSFYECCYEAYMQGIEDASGVDDNIRKMAQGWHYITLEGAPDNDNQHWVLYEYDGRYKDTTLGYYKDGRWVLDYHPNCEYRVLAWHPLPQIG